MIDPSPSTEEGGLAVGAKRRRVGWIFDALSLAVAARGLALGVRLGARRARALVAAAADAIEVIEELAEYREVAAARIVSPRIERRTVCSVSISFGLQSVC